MKLREESETIKLWILEFLHRIALKAEVRLNKAVKRQEEIELNSGKYSYDNAFKYRATYVDKDGNEVPPKD